MHSVSKGTDCKSILVPLEHSGEPTEYLTPRKTLSSCILCPCQWEQHLGIAVMEREAITPSSTWKALSLTLMASRTVQRRMQLKKGK